MNIIHRKSAIDKTAAIIMAAHEHGEKLIWDRYEQQVPLCSFTANGLSCRRCFHGPCRINPFGDEPSQGVCGADRAQIVMENLFQTTLQGVLETARILPCLGDPGAEGEFTDVAGDLPEETRKEYSAIGLIPVRKDQLYEVQNSYFSHKDYLGRTLKDLMRLGLIHYGFLKRIAGFAGQPSRGISSYHSAGANVLVVGQPSSNLMNELKQKAAGHREGKGFNLWGGLKAIASGLSLADHGHPELALKMNTDALVIAPNAAEPGLVELAAKFGVPVFWIDETRPIGELSSQVIDLALRHKRKTAENAFPRQLVPPLPQGDNPLNHPGKIREALEAGRLRGILVVLGEANVKKTFFEMTLALVEKMIPENILVLLGGELGAHADLLQEELGRRLNAKLPDGAAEGGQGEGHSCAHFGLQEIPRVVDFLKEIGQGRRFGSIPAVIAFPEFSRASTWATAVTFLSLGFAVQIASPLPFWGSPALTEVLLKEWPKISGGALLASPSPSPSQRQAEEILSFLKACRAKQV